MDLPLQLAKVECTDSGAATYLTSNDLSTPLSQQKIFSLYPKGADRKAVHFGCDGNTKSIAVPDDPGAFTIQPGTSSSYVFRLNLTNDPSLANAKVEPSIADDGKMARDLASVTCTFERSSFYLKDSAGNFYTLSEVKEHANSIAASGKESPYWTQYTNYLASESTYTCQTTWDGIPYDVRIIGINHDELAEPTEERTVAGLTFQFKNLLKTKYRINPKDKNTGGWGESELRANMNPAASDIPPDSVDEGSIWVQVPTDLRKSLETVKKYYGPTYDDNTSTVNISNDKLFLASYREHSNTIYGESTFAGKEWLSAEGFQYEYWKDKVLNDHSSNPSLRKHIQDESEEIFWWERSISPSSDSSFLVVNKDGDPTTNYGASHTWGICPCFCL